QHDATYKTQNRVPNFPIMCEISMWWGRQDSNLRRRKPADLQSAPFATRDTPPHVSLGFSGDVRNAIIRLKRRELRRRCLAWRADAVSIAESRAVRAPKKRERRAKNGEQNLSKSPTNQCLIT